MRTVGMGLYGGTPGAGRMGVGGDIVVWTPMGTILDASYPEENNQIQEPSVIYDTGAQIFSTADPVFKMWYSGGSGKIWYAESLDGLNWTKYGDSPVISDHTRGFVIKNGVEYIMYAHGGGLNRLISPDGIVWTKTHTGVLSTTAGTWDAHIDNVTVVVDDDNSWIMLYEANSGYVDYQIGLATSPDGITWTKYDGNPVITRTNPGMVGGPWLAKVNGIYRCYAHKSTVGALPTDICFFSSSDLHTWTEAANLIVPRTARNEGVNTIAGQTADASVLEVGGMTYLFYTGMVDGSQPTGHINLATCPHLLSRICISRQQIASEPIYYPELLLANTGFERLGTGGADVFDIWTETAGTGTIEETTGIGEYRPNSSSRRAVKLTAGTSFNTAVSSTVLSTFLVVGGVYRFSGWSRGDGINGGRLRVFGGGNDKIPFPTTLSASNTWTYFSIEFILDALSSLTLYLYCPAANGGIAYFDDVSFKRIR